LSAVLGQVLWSRLKHEGGARARVLGWVAVLAGWAKGPVALGVAPPNRAHPGGLRASKGGPKG
jgi:hypothetical protein